jgi:hypothetical protein
MRNFPGRDGRAPGGEGMFIGCRCYDAKKIERQIPFGFRQSYTTFAYAGIKCDASGER